MRLGLTVLALILGAARAEAAEGPDAYVGLPVADVQLRAPEGGLPEESLQPLLRVRAGEPLHAADIRVDLSTLFQVGQFAAVEADAEPWVIFDADGQPSDAVLLSYVVYPAPRIGRVKVAGEHPHTSRRELLEAANLTRGQVFYPDLDDAGVQRALARYLYARGYTSPEIRVDAEPDADGRLTLTLTVDEGEPNLLERLAFAGDVSDVLPGRRARKLHRWARRAGVREGRPFEPEAITRAQQQIRAELATLRGGPFGRRSGWVGARVTPAVVRTPDGSRVTYTIEPGPRLELDVTGLGWRGERKAQEALGIDERLRITRGWLDEAPDRLEAALRREGWLDAEATVALEDTPAGDQVLRVAVDRGARHVLPVGAPPDWIGVRFEGNEALSDADLQRVMDQASQDVIRRDYFTTDDLAAGIAAARDLYRARGYQEAELSLEVVEERPRPPGPLAILGAPFRALLGDARPVQVLPTVRVDEGPLTTLAEVRIVGAAPEVDLAALEDPLAELRGTPYSPQKVEAISRRLIELHRAAGYLEADARVVAEAVGPSVNEAIVEVRSGPRVLLRSIVTRGPRFTRPAFVRREVESHLTIGAPLTAPALEQVRADLYDLGIFRAVNVSLLGDEAQRDLVLDLGERGRWSYELGAGVATDQGLRTFGRVTRRNLWGRAHRLDVVGQVGLVWRSESLRDWVPDVRNPEWRLAVSYTAPRFPARPQDLVVDGLVRELRQERTWRLARSGGGLALENHLGPRTDLRVGARLETRQLQEVDLGALLPGEPWLPLIEGDLPSRWRVQESLSALVVHDLRNDPVSPTRGVLLSANVEWAPGLDWASLRDQPVTSFVKGAARATAYVPVGALVLRATFEGAHGLSLNDGVLPLEDRYRLGGTGSLRGFRRDAIGPHNLASRLDLDWPEGLGPVVDYAIRDDTERWVPTGGDTSALGLFELLLPLPALGLTGWDGYALAAFADVGNVWLLGDEPLATSELPAWSGDVPLLRVGTGLGLRVATPVGPMQVDFALNPQAAFARGSRRALLAERWEEPPFRAHLTLGALF